MAAVPRCSSVCLSIYQVACTDTGRLLACFCFLIFVSMFSAGVGSDALADGTWLAALYNATNGSKWIAACRTGWNLSNTGDVCLTGWSGVQCNASNSSGVVISVDLNGCNLQGGPLPGVAGLSPGHVGTALEYCKTLHLYNNSLTGTLPSSWNLMSSLVSLRLDSNSLTGALPSTWSSLSSLSSLYLKFNGLTGPLPSSWGSLSSLDVLYSEYNSLMGSLESSWGSLSSLRVLALNSNSLTGTLPQSWSNMSSLRILYLYSNRLTGSLPSSWGVLPTLSYVYLNFNSLAGILPASWGNLSSLEFLALNFNSLTGTLPSSWSNILSLRGLSLDSNRLSGTLPSSWYALKPWNYGDGFLFYDFQFNYLTGDVPPSWLWSNATVVGNISRNCLNAPVNLTAITATARIDIGTPRATFRLKCAPWTETRPTTLSIERTLTSTRSHQNSVTTSLTGSPSNASESDSLSRSLRTISRSLSPFLSYSRSIVSSSQSCKLSSTATGTSTISSKSETATPTRTVAASKSQKRFFSVTGSRSNSTRGFTLTASPESSRSAKHSISRSTASLTTSSACREALVCRVVSANEASAAVSKTSQRIFGGYFLEPLAHDASSSSSLDVVRAQISRESVDSASINTSLLVWIRCTRPAHLQLVNYSTPEMIVQVTTPHPASGSAMFLMLSLPPAGSADGWTRWTPFTGSPYKPFSMKFLLLGTCDALSINVTLEVIVNPRAAPLSAVTAALKAVDRSAMWLGAVGGVGSSGASRIASVQSLMLCSSDEASSGGLLGMSLRRPTDRDTVLSYARGAIAGNMIVLGVWSVTLLMLSVVWMVASRAAFSVACARVALPSSLLPICGALLPSTCGGVLVFASVSPLDVMDIVTLLAGCGLLAAVVAPLLWMGTPSFTRQLNIALFPVSSLPNEHTAARARSSCQSALWRRVFKSQWKWSSLPEVASKGGNNGRQTPKRGGSYLSLAARGCRVVLSEYRSLWYVSLDMIALCAAGMLGGTSVFESNVVCSSAAIALTLLFFSQCTAVVVFRPLTSVFTNIHTAFVLFLMGIGTGLQVLSIKSVSGSGVLLYWIAVGVTLCGFLVVGSSIVRVLVIDLPNLLCAGKSFLCEICTARETSECALVVIERIPSTFDNEQGIITHERGTLTPDPFSEVPMIPFRCAVHDELDSNLSLTEDPFDDTDSSKRSRDEVDTCMSTTEHCPVNEEEKGIDSEDEAEVGALLATFWDDFSGDVALQQETVTQSDVDEAYDLLLCFRRDECLVTLVD